MSIIMAKRTKRINMRACTGVYLQKHSGKTNWESGTYTHVRILYAHMHSAAMPPGKGTLK